MAAKKTEAPEIPARLAEKLGSSIDPDARYFVLMERPREVKAFGRKPMIPAKEYEVKGSILLEIMEDVRDAKLA